MVLYEFKQLYDNKFNPIPIYGSMEKYVYDSIGDVIIPWLLLRAILYAEPKVQVAYLPEVKQFQFVWKL